MVAPPARTEVSDVYPSPSNAVMRAGMGKLWDYVTSLLGATGTPADARAALGLGAADIAWMSKAVGEIFYLRDDLTGVAVPPTNNANYRFIRLAAGDAYNSGVLTSESVSGSAPMITATAVISLSGSPINGRTVNLINTERRFLRAGSPGGLQDDALQDFSGYFELRKMSDGSSQLNGISGMTYSPNGGSAGRSMATIGGALDSDRVTVSPNAAGARVSTETRPRNQGVTAYMRIK